MFGLVYREFARQKYNKYKHQFPRMRQSEIVSKIIQEWDSLSSSDKIQLEKNYQRSHFLEEEDSQYLPNSQIILSQRIQQLSAHKSLCRTETPKKSVKVTKSIKDQDSDFNRVSDNGSQSEGESESYSVELLTPKKNKSGKSNGKESEYVQFYKFHYNRLSEDHPKWQPQQISKIIKLLWQKKQRGRPKVIARLNLVDRKIKKVSGKRQLRRQKVKFGMEIEDLNELWSKFPKETKQQYELKGRQKFDELNRKTILETFTVHCGKEEMKPASFSFLHKPIK